MLIKNDSSRLGLLKVDVLDEESIRRTYPVYQGPRTSRWPRRNEVQVTSGNKGKECRLLADLIFSVSSTSKTQHLL